MKNRLLLAALAPLWALGCGSVTTPEGAPGEPVYVVQARAEGAITDAGELRGALAWRVYTSDLLDCLAPIEVDGELAFEDDADFATAYALKNCLTFSDNGRVEVASVAIEASFPVALSIPLTTLPSTELLSGGSGSRMGVADVLVYEDVENDGVFHETPRGADAFTDIVRGTSWVAHDEDESASLIVYREGALSPLWKIYRALYGCPDPAPGFSTVTVQSTQDGFLCLVDDRVVPVEMNDDLATLGCAPNVAGETPVRADSVDGFPTGGEAFCDAVDGYYDLVFSANPESVCPSFGVYSLVGCDTSSAEACSATFYDLLGDEPSWWPCLYSDNTTLRTFYESPEDAALTSGADALFTLTMSSNLAQLDIERLQVRVTMPSGDAVTLSATLDDTNDNGHWNAGETLAISESTNVFDSSAIPGSYPIVVWYDGELLKEVGFYNPPLAESPLPEITIVIADAPDVIDGVNDDLLSFHYAAAASDAPAYALDTIRTNAYLGNEYGLNSVSRPTFYLSDDANGDGLFGLGDTLVWSAAPDPRFNEPAISVLIPDLGSELNRIDFKVPVGFNTWGAIASVDVVTLE